MSDFEYVKLALKSDLLSKEIRDAIAVLEKHRVFSYLREAADLTLTKTLDNVCETNRLVVTSAEHKGYVRAILNIENLPAIVGAVEELRLSGSTYGVTDEDIK